MCSHFSSFVILGLLFQETSPFLRCIKNLLPEFRGILRQPGPLETTSLIGDFAIVGSGGECETPCPGQRGHSHQGIVGSLLHFPGTSYMIPLNSPSSPTPLEPCLRSPV